MRSACGRWCCQRSTSPAHSWLDLYSARSNAARRRLEGRASRPSVGRSDLLNLSRPTRQMLLDELITFAGSILKFYFVEHRHSSASISDDASLMQRARRQTHAGSASSQHLAEKILRKGKFVGAEQFVAHQQPARQPLLDLMQSVAGRDLHGDRKSV